MKTGQSVKLTKPIWGHKKGTKGRVTKVLSPDDSQTKVNKYVGQIHVKGSPKMYVQHGDVEECAQKVVQFLLEDFPPLGVKQQLPARNRERERKRIRGGTKAKGLYFSGNAGPAPHPIGGGGSGPGIGA